MEPFILPTEGDTARVWLRRLTAFLRADAGSAEPAHVLRVPATLNGKYQPPRRVLLEAVDAARRYHFSDFDDWLPMLHRSEGLPPQSARRMTRSPKASVTTR